MAVEPNLILLPGPGQPGQEAERPRERLEPDVISPWVAPEPSSPGWGGTAVLIVPTAGLFAMVAAVVFVNAVDHWWALVAAMLLALLATLGVVLTILRMLSDDEHGDGASP